MVMEPSSFSLIEQSCKVLGVDLSAAEMAEYVGKNELPPEHLKSITDLFSHLEEKKHQTVIETLLRLSRLPMKVPKTFDN